MTWHDISNKNRYRNSDFYLLTLCTKNIILFAPISNDKIQRKNGVTLKKMYILWECSILNAPIHVYKESPPKHTSQSSTTTSETMYLILWHFVYLGCTQLFSFFNWNLTWNDITWKLSSFHLVERDKTVYP